MLSKKKDLTFSHFHSSPERIIKGEGSCSASSMTQLQALLLVTAQVISLKAVD
jgi:hypothetical protein